MPRSPSPTHSHSSKRRRYTDVDASPTSSSGRRDRDRYRERERDREDDYDRRSSSRRDRDRESSRRYEEDRHHRSSRSSRHHDDDERGDRDSHYSRRSEYSSSSRRTRDYDDDRDYDRRREDGSSRRRDHHREDEDSSRRRDRERRRTRSPSLARSSTRQDSHPPKASTNGHVDSPLRNSAPGSASPMPTAPSTAPDSGAAAAEEEKKRLKREKLEAWKKKKAEEAAASSSKPATPMLNSPSSVSTTPALTPSNASTLAKPPVSSGLPAKPITVAPSASLPSKPVSTLPPSSSVSKSTTAKPLGGSPADATAAAAAAAAAIASRLGTTTFSPFNNKNAAFQKSHALPTVAGLPNKPTFSFGAGAGAAVKNQLARGGMKMGGEDDDAGTKKIGMIKFDDSAVAGAGGGDDTAEDDDDEEDLEGGASYKGGAEAREKRMREIQESEENREGGGTPEVKMEVDEEKPTEDVEMEDDTPVKEETVAEEEEEEDELDAFMSQVNKQVKNVDKEDRKKQIGGKRGADEVIMKNGEEAGEEEEEIEEENTGMTAKDILALAAKNVKKGRELKAPDHKKIDYLPFRKAFYTAPPEVEELTPEEVDVLRLEMDDIKIRGADPPKPATKWSYFGLPAACIDVIKGLEYVAPTSIQAQAIPAIMSGRDIIGVAKTGSGKTMAFILPMFRHIKDQPPLRPMDGPVAMIMTPTRELATQIYKECKPFLKALGLRASCAYGGMPLKDNIADMKRGSEVIVCTPGRMIELLTTNSGRLINLQRVTYLVLDEADRMFDMGFEPQVMKIIGQIRPDRQTVLFSATFPRQMEALARKVLRRPLEITVGGRSVVADTITQVVEVRAEDTKFNRMLELLGKLFNEEEDARALVFVERQESADKLFVELKNKNYTCMPLHGGREQVDRDQTIVDFKNGSCPIVIATSVAARGLDVKQLKMVIQYDVPNHMEDYVHRAGRTGRAGNKGTCITFVTPEQERYSVDILKALQASNAEVPAELKTMAEAFAEKVKAGKEKASGSGFGGKGLEKLDDERAAASRAERAAYGEFGAPAGEKKAGEEGAEEEEGGDNTAQNVADLEIEIMRGPAPDLQKGKVAPAGGGVTVTTDATKLADEAAKKAEQDALAAGKSAATAAAEAVRAKFNAMLKSRRAPPAEPDNSTEAARRRDPDATDYHAVVWINDYPQKARWKVTNKDTMVHFVESTGASITNKGIFYEPGKEPGPNDLPKLHLLIESNEEFRVKHAIAEIKQALIEGATMALEAEQRQPIGGGGGAAAGRYNVV
ncbi:uncharacterized protein JCM6883_006516 [Sporobolomyces salmoneus]|uniref:uncharacterized protein n=1 Tax=Sporobolomyces salmoneus TaxID=183962 RepID=UPI0031823201